MNSSRSTASQIPRVSLPPLSSSFRSKLVADSPASSLSNSLEKFTPCTKGLFATFQAGLGGDTMHVFAVS